MNNKRSKRELAEIVVPIIVGIITAVLVILMRTN